MANAAFDFQKFIDDSKKTLLAPKEYFSGMTKEGGYVEPVIKAAIYGLAAGILSFIWGLLNLSPVGGMLGTATGVTAIIVSPIAAVVGLFIGGLVLLIISAICGGNTNYEANVRATSALMVIMPINALLSFATGINLYFGVILSLAVSLFGLWLLFNAEVNALGGKEGVAKVIVIILAVLTLVSSYYSIKAYTAISSRTTNILKGLEGDKDAKEAQEKAQKMLQELLEKAQKEQK